MIREAELFVLAEQVLVEVIGRVRVEHRSIVLPALFDIRGLDEPVPVYVAVQRHAREEAWVPDLLAGRTMDEVGRDKFDGDLLGEDPQGTVKRLAEAAVGAAGQVSDGGATVHAGHGDVTTRDHLTRLFITRAFLAHDIAFGLGTTACPLTEEFARGALQGTEAEAATWRSRGIFRAPLPLPDRHVSWRDRFLLSAGRDPHPGHYPH